MTHNLIRQVVRAHIEEASRARRQQTRATIAAASDLPTTSSGRVDLAKQIAITGYNLAKETAGAPPRYGFTMTSIQKVGINPSSGFDTPLALYAYPVTPMMVTHLTGGKNMDIALNMPEIEDEIPKYAAVDYELPFVADAPFINFFGFNTTEGIYYTSLGMDDSMYRAVIDRLFRWLKDDSGIDLVRPEYQFRQLLITAQNYNIPRANLSAPAPSDTMSEYQKLATVWSLTRALSMVAVAADFDAMKASGQTPTQSTISLWRSLLLMVGIKAIVDDEGKGLIHKQEPEQIAIMDTSIIEPIQQFDNVTLAGKRSREGDLYLKRNPDSLNKLANEYVGRITKLVKRMQNEDADKNLVFLNLTQELAAVYMSDTGSKRVVVEIRKLGLMDDITDFTVSVIPRLQQETFDRAAGSFVYIYAMTGSKRFLDAVASRLTEPPDQGFINLARHIGSIHSDPGANVTKYIIEICQAAFEKLKGSVTQYAYEADEMLRLLAGSKIMAETMNISQFRQLIGPIYKALPDEMTSSSVTSIASGRLVSRMDSYLELFGEYEVNKTLGKERTQLQALEKKKLYKPETTGLYTNLGDLDKLRNRLKIILDRARRALYTLLDVLNDKDHFFKTGSRLNIDEYDFAPGQFIQSTIQSANPAQLQKVADIWLSYVKKIRKASDGPDLLNILYDIGQANPGIQHSDPKYDELMKAELFEHAQLQVAAIHEAIEDLEKEMTAQIESMDDKRAETSPLYERLITRWL